MGGTLHVTRGEGPVRAAKRREGKRFAQDIEMMHKAGCRGIRLMMGTGIDARTRLKWAGQALRVLTWAPARARASRSQSPSVRARTVSRCHRQSTHVDAVVSSMTAIHWRVKAAAIRGSGVAPAREHSRDHESDVNVT